MQSNPLIYHQNTLPIPQNTQSFPNPQNTQSFPNPQNTQSFPNPQNTQSLTHHQNTPTSKPSFIEAGWSSGICGCCYGPYANPGMFCMACCPCTGGMAQAILLKDLGLVSSCVYPALLYAGLDLFTGRSFMILILTSLRISMSDKLKREEGPCQSFCLACCCYPCALAQLERDINARKYAFKNAEGGCNTVKTYLGAIDGSPIPYVAPEEMQPLVQNGMPL
jgi:Cys-rich protein (TIGR01571 family)